MTITEAIWSESYARERHRLYAEACASGIDATCHSRINLAAMLYADNAVRGLRCNSIDELQAGIAALMPQSPPDPVED